MAQQTINVGTAPNDGTGTPLRTAFQYTNSNFSELYTAVGPSGNNIVVPGSATITGDLTVDTSTLKVDSALNKVGVGVATLTGLQTFNVAGDVGITSDLVLKNSGGTVQGYIFGSSGLNYRVIAGQPHVWQEGGSDLMRLNSTGLGVGGSPSYKLDVQGTSAGVLRLVNINNSSTDPAAVTRLSLDSQGATWHLDNERTSGIFKITRNSTACLTIDNSGNVGIGVTPSAWGSNYKVVQVGQAGAVYGSAPTGFYGTKFNIYNDNTNDISITNNFVGEYRFNILNGSHIWFNKSTSSGGIGVNQTLTQAMTLDASGNLLVGTPSVGGVFDTKFYLSSNSGTNKWAVGPYGTATNFAIIPTPGTGGVYLSGTSATSWTAYSDERLKDIIEPITNALTKVGSLRSVIGKFKGDEANTRRPFLIAQDLQSALPEAVDASNPDRLGVAYTDVIPLLVAAIKELTAEVNALKNA